jgi:hypothetical protein
MMSVAEQALAWSLIGFGLYALTEGYHAFRRRAAGEFAAWRSSFTAGLIVAAGFGMISIGFALRGC